MVAERGEIDQARYRLLKTARTVIRLRHSLAADDELNQALPALAEAFNTAVNAGQLPDDQTIEVIIRGVLDG